jgi:hypothetical protein
VSGATDYGIFNVAFEPNGTALVFAHSITDAAALSFAAPNTLSTSFQVSVPEDVGLPVYGSFLDPDFMSGEFGDDLDGRFSFQAARIGEANALYRCTGPYVNEGDLAGFVVLDVDASNNVAGVEYQFYEPFPDIANLQVAISGSIMGSTFTGTLGGKPVTGAYTSNPMTLSLRSSADERHFEAVGCRLN